MPKRTVFDDAGRYVGQMNLRRVDAKVEGGHGCLLAAEGFTADPDDAVVIACDEVGTEQHRAALVDAHGRLIRWMSRRSVEHVLYAESVHGHPSPRVIGDPVGIVMLSRKLSRDELESYNHEAFLQQADYTVRKVTLVQGILSFLRETLSPQSQLSPWKLNRLALFMKVVGQHIERGGDEQTLVKAADRLLNSPSVGMAWSADESPEVLQRNAICRILEELHFAHKVRPLRELDEAIHEIVALYGGLLSRRHLDEAYGNAQRRYARWLERAKRLDSRMATEGAEEARAAAGGGRIEASGVRRGRVDNLGRQSVADAQGWEAARGAS